MNEPRKVELQPDGGLAILWSDGHRSSHGGRALRLACQCALCKDEWSGEQRLDATSLPTDVTVHHVSPVGRYGLQLSFSDGHNTGIFTFQRLRSLCSCEACRTAEPR